MKILNDVRKVVLNGNIKEIDYLSVSVSDFKSLPERNTHIISEDEIGRLDLVSIREYGSDRYWWVIGIYNDILDPIDQMIIGDKFSIPNLNGLSFILSTYRRINGR